MSYISLGYQFFRYLGLAVCALFLSISLLITTHWGNQLLISALNYIEPNIRLDLRRGSLLNDLEVEDIGVNLPGIKLNIGSLSVNWDWQCLIKAGFCVDSIELDNTTLDITALNSGPEQTPRPLEPIELPFWFKVRQIKIKNVAISILGNKISWQQLQLAMQLKNSTLNLDHLTLNELTTQLTDNQPSIADKEPSAINKESPANNKTSAHHQPIELPKILLPIAIELSSLTLLNTKIIQRDHIENIEKITLALSAGKHDIKVKQLNIEHQLADIELKGTLSLTDKYPLLAATRVITKPKLTIGENTITVKLSGPLDKLTTTIAVNGDLNADFDSQLNLLNPLYPFDISGNWQEFSVPNNPITIKSGELNAQGSLEQFSYQLDTGLVSPNIPATEISTKGHGSKKDLIITMLKVNMLNGEINSTASLNWQNALTWQAALTLSNIEPQQMWPQLNANINGGFSTNGIVNGADWQIALNNLDLTGQWLAQPLSLSGNVLGHSNKLPYGQWQVNRVRLNNGINSILLNGTIDNNIDINAAINVDDLAQSVPTMMGKIIANLQLRGNISSPNILLNVNGSGINAPSLQLEIASLTAQGKLTSTLDGDNQLSFNIKQAQLANQQISEANFALSGSWQQHIAKLLIKGQPLAANVELTGQYRAQYWQGQITKSIIESPIGQWLASEKIAVSFDASSPQLSVAQHCWQQYTPQQPTAITTTATLCLTRPVIAGKRGDISLALSRFNLNAINPLLQQPVNIAGIIDITANANWQPDSKPHVNAAINGAQGKVVITTQQGDLISHYHDLLATLALESNQATVALKVVSPEIGKLSMSADTNVYQPDSPLTGEIILESIKLSAFKGLLPGIDNLTGEINTNTRVSGTLKAPLLNGEIKLSDGNITGLSLPAQVEKLNATIALKGDGAKLSGDFILGQGNGKIGGEVQWQPDLSAELTVNGSAMTVSPTSNMSITFSPNIAAKYTKEQLSIGGQISIDKGKVKIKALPESAVSLSDDVVIVSSQEARPQPRTNKLALLLALKVLINEKLHIDAFGLSSSLAGQLSLAQDPQTPLNGHGELNLINAKYIAMGQNLNIRRGKMLFTGSLSQPYLNIEAIREPELTEDGVVAGLNVTGSARQPKLEIFSEPAMSQQEAISYLLRGRKINSKDTTTGENMLIGMLLNSTLEYSGNLVNNIGNKVGITDMSFNAKGSGDDTAVELSGYIAPNIELRYTVGVFDSQPEFSIRYQLMPRLFVDIVKDTDETLDLLYNFDFD